MNALHIDLGEEWRGGQQQALLLMRGLRERGHGAELVAIPGSALARRARAEGLTVHAAARFASQLLTAWPLKILKEQSRFDIVHIHDAHGLTPAWLAGMYKSARLVASRRVIYPIPQNPLALARYQAMHAVVAVSRYVKEILLGSGLKSAQVEVICDGVEMPPLTADRERREARQAWNLGDGPVLGYVGYFLPEKGHEQLLRAMPLIRERHPECRLLLPGEGPCRAPLQQLARQLGLESAVLFPGFVNDIERVYRALDFYVFPSWAEGLGSSLLSAMSYGVPPAAVARCAVPEIIQDAVNGLLVPAPEPTAIAAAVLRLLDNDVLAARLGAAARQTVAHAFSAERMVEETLRLYQRLCAEPVRDA